MVKLNRLERQGNGVLVLLDNGDRIMCYPVPGGGWMPRGHQPFADVEPEPDPDPEEPDPTPGAFAWPFDHGSIAGGAGGPNETGENWPGGTSSDRPNHTGRDWGVGRAQAGADVLCIGAGVVSQIYKTSYSPYGGGYEVTVDHGTLSDGNRYWSQYAHMQYQSNWHLGVGSAVRLGTRLGNIGSTGNSTGAHLHMGIMRNQIAAYIDGRGFMATFNPTDVQQ